MAEEHTGNNGKKKKAFMLVAVIVVVGLVLGHFYNSYRKTHVATDDAFIDGDIFTVAAKINGTVLTVPVSANQAVKKGDLLLELDPADYDVKLREASSGLGVEKARFSEAEARIATARANLELQRTNLKQAETDKSRAENLFQKEAISRDRYDKALSAYEVCLAQVRAAEEQLRQAESQKLTQASTIKQKEATAALADLNAQYTRIYAPADGYVTKKNVQPGNQVQAGQPLMAIVSLENLYVVANYKETELENIRPGQPVQIKVDSYPDKVFKGKVDSIMAGTGVTFSLFPAENATGNYVKVVQRIPIKIVLEQGTDRDHVLRIGMSVEPTVLTK